MKMTGLRWPEALNRLAAGVATFAEHYPVSGAFHNYFYIQDGEPHEIFHGNHRGVVSGEHLERLERLEGYLFRLTDTPSNP